MAAERLDSWKEIAAYLNRDVATVRRWEKRERLPVHRHLHEKLGSVYAFTSELDAWQEQRRGQVDGRPNTSLRSARVVQVVLVVGLVAAAAGAAYLVREPARKDDVHPRLRLAIHRPGTVASLLAAGLQDVLHRALPDTEIVLVEQSGMVNTLRAIDGGSVDLGLAFNLLAFHAVKTDQLLGHRGDAITALTVAYFTPAQIVVRGDSPIKAVADLRGKRVSLGIAESGERFCSEILLSHYGFGAAALSDQFIDFGPSLTALLKGELDAYITWRGMPAPDVTEAFATGTLRLIPLDLESVRGLRLKHPFLVPWTIPSRVYPHQEAPVPTVSGRILLLASRSLPSDLVEQVLRTIRAQMPDLVARHPAAAEINVKTRPTLDEGLSIDLHPGAEQFFRSTSIP